MFKGKVRKNVIAILYYIFDCIFACLVLYALITIVKNISLSYDDSLSGILRIIIYMLSAYPYIKYFFKEVEVTNIYIGILLWFTKLPAIYFITSFIINI